ncbi:MAG: hypothetical protein ABR924_06805 [Terracidiphilus sp.]
MRIVLTVLLLAASTFAQAQPVGLSAACGPDDVSFHVTLDKSQHKLEQPGPGKALAYFFQDEAWAKIGLDGAWVGANRGHSYFSVPVEPGEHHICVNARSKDYPTEVAHLSAEAGKVYYYRVRVLGITDGSYLFLGAIDSDEAKYLIASYSLSVSRPKPRGEAPALPRCCLF